jgi:hypothetical protein
MRNEEVFTCWMRIFGGPEAEEEVCKSMRVVFFGSGDMNWPVASGMAISVGDSGLPGILSTFWEDSQHWCWCWRLARERRNA